MKNKFIKLKYIIFCIIIFIGMNGCISSAIDEKDQEKIFIENIENSKDIDKKDSNYDNINIDYNDDLTVIGSIHDDALQALTEIFQEKTGCIVNYINLPTVDVQKKLTNDAPYPEANVWIGSTVIYHELMKKKGLLAPCIVENGKYINQINLDHEKVWKGEYLDTLSIGVNEKLWKYHFRNYIKKMPSTLEDLLRPEYKGKIIIPNPTTSSAGYNFVISILEYMGEDAGMKYLKLLNEQVGEYSDRGYTASEKVAFGEYMICVNFLSDQLIMKDLGYNMYSQIYNGSISTQIPISLIVGSEDNNKAKEFIDFCLSDEAGDILAGLQKVKPVRNSCIIPDYYKDIKMPTLPDNKTVKYYVDNYDNIIKKIKSILNLKK